MPATAPSSAPSSPSSAAPASDSSLDALLAPTDAFAPRHTSPTPAERAPKLAAVGYPTPHPPFDAPL
ncbi:MAG: 2-oxoglutarate dehydrogenase, E2 component, dihydrolipoamide succinyltransferase, partial [Burkholderiales bacterium]|nr:2-oxoglutarate dehydrogenase, E2 component, dihydrolipoamide succinyltransferase [Opitutaceae bacterium]